MFSCFYFVQQDTLGETVLEFDSLKRAGEERQQLFHKILGKKVGGWRGQVSFACLTFELSISLAEY